MTDNEEQNQSNEQEKSTETSGTKISPMLWIVMLATVLLLSASGFVLGHLMGGTSDKNPGEQDQEKIESTKPKDEKSSDKEQKTWYYNELESIIVNPDEPGARRFVRVGLILEMSEKVEQENAKTLIENKKPLMINWLNLYFKGLSLDEMENERDMNRILSQVRDGFNEILFPDSEPQIEKILIREFNIQ